MSDPFAHYIPRNRQEQLLVDTQRKLHQQKVEKERAWQKQQADLMKPKQEAHSPLYHMPGRR